jgi:hypothetical protein
MRENARVNPELSIPCSISTRKWNLPLQMLIKGDFLEYARLLRASLTSAIPREVNLGISVAWG